MNGDTGMTGQNFYAKIIALWYDTIPRYGTVPYGRNDKIILNTMMADVPYKRSREISRTGRNRESLNFLIPLTKKFVKSPKPVAGRYFMITKTNG